MKKFVLAALALGLFCTMAQATHFRTRFVAVSVNTPVLVAPAVYQAPVAVQGNCGAVGVNGYGVGSCSVPTFAAVNSVGVYNAPVFANSAYGFSGVRLQVGGINRFNRFNSFNLSVGGFAPAFQRQVIVNRFGRTVIRTRIR